MPIGRKMLLSKEAEKIQYETWKRMSPAKKIKILSDFFEFAKKLQKLNYIKNWAVPL